MRIPFLLLALVGFGLHVRAQGVPNSLGKAGLPPHQVPTKASELFNETMVWTVHLKFSPEQFAAIEPKNAETNPLRGGGNRRGPDAMASMLAPGFLKEGDLNHDGVLSKDEFKALGEKWFDAWDNSKSGKLGIDQIRTGLSTAIGLPSSRLQGPEGMRNGLAAAQGVEFVYVHADLEFEGQTIKDVGVRYKGNGTWMNSQGSIKKSMKIDLNHFVQGQKFAGVAKLNLHNNVTDASFMNEMLSHKLYRDAGVPAPRSAYARVYVTVPGKYEHQYFGLYSIIEDIDKHFEREILKAKDGAIFKPVTPNLFGDLGDDWAKYKQSYDPKTDLTEAQIKRVIEFSRFLTKADDAEFAAKIGDYLDLDEFSRYMSVTVWLATLDSLLSMGQNFYVYLDPKTNTFQFLPWDLDHSFGQFGMGGSDEQRDNLSIMHPWRGEMRLLERVYKVEAFKKLYLARFEEFDKTIFVPERIIKQVDEFGAALRPAVKDESATMLERFDKVVAGEAVAQGGRRGFFGASIKPIKGFVAARAPAVVAQVAGKSPGVTLADNGRGGGGFGGPGAMMGQMFLTALDLNRDGEVSREEFTVGFARWFAAWNTDRSGKLTETQLSAGINRELSNLRGGNQRRGGLGFGGRGVGILGQNP